MKPLSQLCIVIPVYNESFGLETLIHTWRKVCMEMNIPYLFVIVNDGSKDESLLVLQNLNAAQKDIHIISQENCGHGPSIYSAYKYSLGADWIFQIDADNTYSPEAFEKMWLIKDEHNFLLGKRQQRNASLGRRIISLASIYITKFLFSISTNDINTPYRLIRTSALAPVLEIIPSKSFAPNILITLYFLKKEGKIEHILLKNTELKVVKKSKMNSYFINGAVAAFYQTLKFRLKL